MKKLILTTVVLITLFSFTSIIHANVTPVQEELSESSQQNQVQDKALIQAQAIVDKANKEIQDVIDTTCLKAEGVLAKYNAGKFTLEEKDAKINGLIDKMIDKTNKISLKAQKQAAKLGIKVECSLIEVIIDDRSIMVDPIFIVGT